jgi:glutathione S-transferase
MKFYDCQSAPSPRRARIFIAEKQLEVESIEVDLGQLEQLGETFRAINPRCTVPVLQLDDGTCLTENQGIAAYLDALAPDPPLLGVTPEERGLVANWNARAELEGLWPLADALRNRSKGFAKRAITGPTDYAQIPELAERGLARATEFFEALDERLGEATYLAGDRFSFADITAFVSVEFAAWVKLRPIDAHNNTKRWHASVAARPSVGS